MRKELLSPAGSIECAYAAINNGADAIYLSGKDFGARAFAPNFSDEEILEIINYAHLVDVKIYVTINTLISDNEFEDVLKYIEFLHINNIDAVIVQDIGLTSVLRNMFPNLELHASTQMHNLDSYSCKFLEQLGFTRVVLSRELSLSEINKIDTNLEIESFIHGSLCVSYSGECLLSSMAMNRSGNRGACSQLCRMPYKLKVNEQLCDLKGNYLLSPKDLATFNNFDEIMKSNIVSLKIEGRMKSAAYVGLVTKIYRKLIDGYYENSSVDIKEDIEKLKYLFNRGYTEGFILEDNNIINNKRGNHAGVLIGKVLDVTKEEIKVLLYDDLNIKDGIKFELEDKGFTVYNMYINGIEVKSAKEKDIIMLPNKIELSSLDNVLKTYDDLLNISLSTSDSKKIGIDVKVEAIVGKALRVTINDYTNEVTGSSDIVTKANNKEVSLEDITSKISKLGNTVYKINNLDIIKDDNIFIRLSDINALRRELTDKLNSKRLERNKEYIKNRDNTIFENKNNDNTLSVYIRNNRQLGIIKDYKIDRIYTDNMDIVVNNPDLNIYYETNINDVIPDNINKLLINSTSDLVKYHNKKVILNYSFNIYNSVALNYLNQYGLCSYSVELGLDKISKINKEIVSSAELLIYGKVKVMTLKTCVINNDKKCGNCSVNTCDKVLVDEFQREYVVKCNNETNYIYNHKPVLKIRDLIIYKNIGIKKFRIDFLNESDHEIRKILNEFFS